MTGKAVNIKKLFVTLVRWLRPVKDEVRDWPGKQVPVHSRGRVDGSEGGWEVVFARFPRLNLAKKSAHIPPTAKAKRPLWGDMKPLVAQKCWRL